MEGAMAMGVLADKRLLAVDDEPDILEVLKEGLGKTGVAIDTATSYEEGLQRLQSFTYDLAILDIMGVRGFDLLEVATSREVPVIMLTAHALSPEALKRSIELGARAYVPKDEIDNIAPFVEDVFTLSYQSAWKALFTKLGHFFGARFGPNWRTSEEEFWKKFEKDLEVSQSTIIES
jgi:CheY-like chemotaxis protein